MKSKNLCFIIIVLMFFLFKLNTDAEYSELPLEVSRNNFREVGLVKTAITEEGNTYIAWQQTEVDDDNNSKTSIYLQLIDKNGKYCWDNIGLFISFIKDVDFNFYEDINLTTTENGDAILSFVYLRKNQEKGICINKINQKKEIIWQKTHQDIYPEEVNSTTNQFCLSICENNIIVCNVTSQKSFIQILSLDGNILLQDKLEIDAPIVNPSIIGSIDSTFICVYRLNKTLFADRYEFNGNVKWKAVYIGNETCDELDFYDKNYVFSDGIGGAIITWEVQQKDNNKNKDIFVQRLNALGKRLFTNDGINISIGELNQNHVTDVDIKNNIIHICWNTSIFGKKSIVLQRLDFEGNKLYSENGMVLMKDINLSIDNKPLFVVHIPNKRVLVVVKYKEINDYIYEMYAFRADENETIFWEKKLDIEKNIFHNQVSTSFFNDQIVIVWCDENPYIKTLDNKTIKAMNLSYNGIIGLDESAITNNIDCIYAFPNPTKDFANLMVKLKIPQFVNVKLYDVKGNTIYNNNVYLNEGENLLNFNLGDLVAGSYIVSIYSTTNNKLYNYSILKY